MLIDVYDFDGTIYDGDSTFDFCCFCLGRHPVLLTGLPRLLWAGIRLGVGRIGLTAFKTVLLGIMAKHFDLETEAEIFWQQDKTLIKLGAWFKDTPRDLPMIMASASPEFELQYPAKILGFETMLGTRCNTKTGELIGLNCKGEEKLRRIGQVVGEYEIRAMYTDSVKSDGPLLDVAREGYIIKHGVLSPYEKGHEGEKR